MPVTALILALLVALTPDRVFADRVLVELGLAPSIVAEADHWSGDAGMPTILLLHGFLQTRESPTVRRLAEALADQGFGVLTPSLSLGLSRRRQSVACEAIHTHSMQQDVAELRAWTEWLTEHSGRAPVLIGVDSAGAQLLAMLEAYPDLRVARSVLISPSYFGDEQGPQLVARLEARAADAMRRADEGMQRFALTYCGNYVTTADRLMSYLDWGRERLESAVRRVRTPVAVIFGDEDGRIDRQWLVAMGDHGVKVRPVDGADHFFGPAYEFDLLDEVIQLVSGREHG